MSYSKTVFHDTLVRFPVNHWIENNFCKLKENRCDEGICYSFISLYTFFVQKIEEYYMRDDKMLWQKYLPSGLAEKQS